MAAQGQASGIRNPPLKSTAQLLDYLGELQKRTKAKFPQPLETGALAAWLEDWLKLCQAVGMERFEAGLHRCWQECKFFPLPAEIRERIPESGTRLQVTYDDNCAWCWGLGYKPANGEKRSQQTMLNRMIRCHCRKIDFVREL